MEHQQSWMDAGSLRPHTLFLDVLRSCLGQDLQGAYQLSVLWKGLRNRKGAADWAGTGFM